MNASTAVPARVLIVEDSPEFSLHLVRLIARNANVTVTGKAEDGLSAVSLAMACKPDVVLLDIGLPGINGIEVARRLRQLSLDCKIVFVTQESSHDIIQEAMSTGACGYVLKCRIENDLPIVLESVSLGQSFVSNTGESS